MGKYDQFKFYEITKQSEKQKKKSDGDDDKRVKHKDEKEKRKNKTKDKEIDENAVRVFKNYNEIDAYLKRHPDYEIYPFVLTDFWIKRGFTKTIFDYLKENKTEWEEDEKNEQNRNKKSTGRAHTAGD